MKRLTYLILGIILALVAAIVSNESRADTLQFCSPTVASAQSVAGTNGYTTTVTSLTAFQAGACTAPPPPPPPGSCATFAGFSRLSGSYDVNYFGDGHKTVDVTQFNAVYWLPWPGRIGLNADFSLPTTNYISMVFTVPAGAANQQGAYYISEAAFGARVGATISRSCGDFSNPSTNSASTVVPGCWKSMQLAGGRLVWNTPGTATSCVLTPGTYYLNLIDADISNAPAAAPSTKTAKCISGSCPLTIQNIQ